ncbi:hypothetical protein K491DRAFT_675075 [Lophiostoma macrostomum CBS 122681]|uniref:BTB domain-containing protein n=1 Tax=Lophiostoma macrostomum CBS 122681 TaxID=1314788 RepID=A0A6A6TJH2_9PLEO|nr:hypothetical protein K491DRAFT_675075 [Lophiostoma macrostomum CBS 122681]
MAGAIDPFVIDPDGDLILEVRQDKESARFAFRVDSSVLQRNSPYFERLLSDHFREGQEFAATRNALRLAGYSNIAEVPAEALPTIELIDVGRISKVSSIQNLVADFLRAVHSLDLPAHPPIANLANLAVVADRFECVPYIARFVQRKRYIQAIDAKTKSRSSTSLPEERVRQKLLIGLLFDHPPWVTKYSKQLILGDSSQWRPGVVVDDTAALWWDLPRNVEDELVKRREYILETVNSLQAHFLKKYASGERQCKLGYDSSVQCDSFQLGEMIRFFSRLGTLRLQGTIYDPREPTWHTGDIGRLLESLRQCPSYQIDRNHSHCGLRTRLLPLLDLIQNQLSLDTASLDISICADCWNSNREYAWSLAKRPVLWIQPTSTGNRSLAPTFTKKGHQRTPSSCLGRHIVVREMFMAQERDWTARDAY